MFAIKRKRKYKPRRQDWLTLDYIESRLEGVKRNGQGLMAKCPCHDDKVRSFSARQEKERVLIYCHAGCTFSTLLDFFRP